MGTSLAERKLQNADLTVGQLPLGLESPAHFADSAAGAARHLLARRTVLDDTLRRPPSEEPPSCCAPRLFPRHC